MKTLSIISQKGGAGKTTLALHLASSMSHAGHDTALIDLDPQASATNWGDRREADLPVVISAHASRLGHEIERIRKSGGEMLVIDTAPHADSTALAAAEASDMILIPCRPSILDLEAFANTLNLVKTAGKPICVIMNAVAPTGTEAQEAIDAISVFDVMICPAHLGRRVDFARALIDGQTAQEYAPQSKAAQELAHVHTFVYDYLHMINESKEVAYA